ncbi:hypothetical protein B5X10_00660 [Campylobacter lari]|nr:hypothetical protein [Campylobacter lari]
MKTTQKYLIFYSGIGGYDNNRIIGHFGGGIRYYPNALALNNSGNIMLGLNLVYDHDFSRKHKRISLGFESVLDTLAFHANIYQSIMLKNGFNQAVKNVAMSVTPEQRSVILKNGNHYITDDNGKVFAKIIHAYGVHQTNLIAKAGNAQESFPITIVAPRQYFRVFAKPSNIQDMKNL